MISFWRSGFGCSLGFFLGFCFVLFVDLFVFYNLSWALFLFFSGRGWGGGFVSVFTFSLFSNHAMQLAGSWSLGRSWALVSRVGALSLRYWSAGKVPDFREY